MDLKVDGKDVSTLRVVDLRVELQRRGQSKSGSKKDLVERLMQCMKEGKTLSNILVNLFLRITVKAAKCDHFGPDPK